MSLSYIVKVTRGILNLDVFESLAERVRKEILSYTSSLPVITCAASLAHHGLLGFVKRMRLIDENAIRLGHVDLTSIPPEHLASLVTGYDRHIYIINVSGLDLITILDNVKSEWLTIKSQSLGREETLALVRAMESSVEGVTLSEGATLDIRVLMEYSGQGKCECIECKFDTAPRYREQLRTWAMSKSWQVSLDLAREFLILNSSLDIYNDII